MKKLSICAAAIIALAMTACDNGKTGTIEGEVRDAFTNKPLEMPTVGMDSTIYTTLSKKYELVRIQPGTPQGQVQVRQGSGWRL